MIAFFAFSSTNVGHSQLLAVSRLLESGHVSFQLLSRKQCLIVFGVILGGKGVAWGHSGLQSLPVSMESLALGLGRMWYLCVSGLGQVTQPLGCGRGSA